MLTVVESEPGQRASHEGRVLPFPAAANCDTCSSGCSRPEKTRFPRTGDGFTRQPQVALGLLGRIRVDRWWLLLGFSGIQSFLQCQSNGLKEPITENCVRSETCSQPTSKASREKMRRDKLNDRFLELAANEAKKLKESNDTLQEKIKELKAEKNELLRGETEAKGRQGESGAIKLLNARSGYVPHPPFIQAPFTVQSQAAGNKLIMLVIGYPGFPMWQFMPPIDIDTSQDADKCPPVA
ncbi:hypothetical protein OPV22_008768 [Ensete ventricosum]|uniref:BZIP domain-containing protein n=1 Tax=Ensete ventricosum TaxID=4639 RepID=A0AAV8RDI4_ENSVE|nr:hypothetical protein OPV22_008768 [Ensete ventricosum]